MEFYPMRADKKIEHRLIDGCIAGDRKAQEELYDRYAAKMYGICLGFTKNELEAQDLLQEGFIKVFKNISQCNKNGSLEGWIRRVIVNNNIDHYRSNKNKGEKVEFSDEFVEDIHNANENDAVKDMQEKDFLNFLQKLPAGYRVVLNLYLVEGYTHKEIGEALGVSRETSKSQFFRAKQMLKNKFGDKIEKEGILAVL